jgi:hypothetical protein
MTNENAYAACQKCRLCSNVCKKARLERYLAISKQKDMKVVCGTRIAKRVALSCPWMRSSVQLELLRYVSTVEELTY